MEQQGSTGHTIVEIIEIGAGIICDFSFNKVINGTFYFSLYILWFVSGIISGLLFFADAFELLINNK